MAEPFELQGSKTSFMDVLRTLATVGGAGLSAHPQGRPVGAMLLAGSSLIGAAQDKARESAYSSALGEASRGSASLPSIYQALAQKGWLNNDIRQQLAEANYQARIDPIRGATLEAVTGPAPAIPGPATAAPTQLGGLAPPEAMEMADDLPAPPAPEDVRFMQPPTGDRAQVMAENINRLASLPGGGGMAQLAITFPRAASTMLRQRQMKQAARQHEQSELRLSRGQMQAEQRHAERERRLLSERDLKQRKLQREIEKEQAGARLYEQAFAPQSDPRETHDLGVAAIKAGVAPNVVKALTDPREDMRVEIREYIQAAGINPRSAIEGDIEAAQKKAQYEKTKAAAREKGILLETLQTYQRNQPIHDANTLLQFMHPETFEAPPPGLSPQEITEAGYMPMDKQGRTTMKIVQQGEDILGMLENLSLGGPVDAKTARSLGVQPGTVLPSLFVPDDPEMSSEDYFGRIRNRFTGTLGMHFETLAQTARGRRAQLYTRLYNEFLGLFSRGIGGQRGHVTDRDAIYAKQGFPVAVPEQLTGLQDTEELARSMFQTKKDLLERLKSRAVGWNGLTQAGQLPPPAPAEAGAESGAEGEGAVAPPPPEALGSAPTREETSSALDALEQWMNMQMQQGGR